MPDLRRVKMTRSVQVDHSVIELITSFATTSGFKETGGPLFGRSRDETVEIQLAFGPGRWSRHARHSFEPNRRSVQKRINRVWRDSNGTQTYLGSWHTHPNGAAVPSLTDKSTAARMAAQSDLLLPEPILIIQETSIVARQAPVMRETAIWIWDPAIEKLVRAETGQSAASSSVNN